MNFLSFQSSAAYVNGDSAPSVGERELEVRWKFNHFCLF